MNPVIPGGTRASHTYNWTAHWLLYGVWFYARLRGQNKGARSSQNEKALTDSLGLTVLRTSQSLFEYFPAFARLFKKPVTDLEIGSVTDM